MITIFQIFLALSLSQVWSWNLASLRKPLRSHDLMTRRRAILPLISVSTLTLATPSSQAKSPEEGIVSPERVSDLLKKVPTFTIVDTDGVPYMVVGEDAKVTGYFFTTYGEAKRLLNVAKSSADKAIKEAKAEMKLNPSANQDPIGENPWAKARIISVPLDFAVTLASKSTSAAYFRVAPADDDVADALKIIGKDDLAEGKVPLFYFQNFSFEETGDKQSPVYFRKAELLEAWKNANGNIDPPEIEVTELFSVLKAMIKPGGTDKELASIVFVPPKESKQKAKECNKAGKSKDTFQIGRRNLVL
mmetsp:Transcript_3421/g.5209  ORF Transcript_3421/g.5209 Transcript_3421/m.5209 type:complete len:304 (-) Transcript_3421:62-973(-)